MALRNTGNAWGWPARLLHWVMAVIIFFMLGVGFYMAEFVDDMIVQFRLVQLHKSWGFVVFALVALRLVWRMANRTPAAPSGASAAERFIAHAGHIALYVLMFALPLTGWLMSSASTLNDVDAYPVQIRNMVFGLFELPDPISPGDKALSERIGAVHFWCALALTGLVIGHALAALKHHFVERDNVLTRMISGR